MINNLKKLCSILDQHNFNGIELSANIDYIEKDQLIEVITKFQQMKFFIHNYFPKPIKSIVLNPAHHKTALKTIRHAKMAIDLCNECGIKQYSLHSGAAINMSPHELGNKQFHLKPIPMEESRKILLDSCFEIAEYAKQKNVELLLENNVASKNNCPNGINDRYHLTDIEESYELKPLFEHSNIGILLDTGHLKVSAKTLNFDIKTFLMTFNDKIHAVHISENDAESDQNLPITEHSWFWNMIPWKNVDYVSLEVIGLNASELQHQIDLTNRMIKLNERRL